MKYDVKPLIRSVCHETGEGPHWDAASKELYFVDLCQVDFPDSRVFRYNADTGELRSHAFENTTVSSIVPSSDGNFILTIDNTVNKFQWDSKTLSKMCSVEPETRFNDAKCDANGVLLAGTMKVERGTFEIQDPSPAVNVVKPLGSLYSLKQNSSQLDKLDSPIFLSNGLDWTSDNRTMFFVDSIPCKVYAYDYDISRSVVSNRRVAIDFQKLGFSDVGVPDGCCIDANNNLWVACYGASKVVCFDTKTGSKLDEISFPCRRMTSCCFGGPNLTELYVTSAMFPGEAAISGSVFKVTGPNLKGVPMRKYNV